MFVVSRKSCALFTTFTKIQGLILSAVSLLFLYTHTYIDIYFVEFGTTRVICEYLNRIKGAHQSIRVCLGNGYKGMEPLFWKKIIVTLISLNPSSTFL